jgi:hypothetical protein
MVFHLAMDRVKPMPVFAWRFFVQIDVGNGYYYTLFFGS